MALLRDFVKEAARGKGAEQLGVDGLASRWRGDYPSRAATAQLWERVAVWSRT